MKTSKQFELDFKDITKSLITAGLTSCLVIVQQTIETSSINNINWKAVGMAFVGGCLGYLIKNFFTPSKVILKDEK